MSDDQAKPSRMDDGWIGVDFDGTLAVYEPGDFKKHGPGFVGEPIPMMVDRVRNWLEDGRQVRIFTARCFPFALVPPNTAVVIPKEGEPRILERMRQSQLSIAAIRKWCTQHLGFQLAITCQKDFDMIELYDDRCVQVEANTGVLVGESTRGL